jgi:uncharacterized protein YlxW (UPF0749 family)
MLDGPTPPKPAGAQPRPSDRPAASSSSPSSLPTSLLDEIWQEALDRDYAEAARRAPAAVSAAADAGTGATGRFRPRSGSVLVASALVLLGLLTAAAVVQVQRRAPAAAQTRHVLIREIDQRTTDTDRLQEGVEALRVGVGRAQREALRLSDRGEALDDKIGQLELGTGVVPVTGPGLRVVVDDAKPANGVDRPASDGVDATRVLDRDLQVLVNGLWVAGAEAVAINNQRITVLVAIRSAGDAILVDYRPLSPPYTIEAIGDPDRMEAAFAQTAAGRELQLVKETFGIRFDVSTVKHLELPAGSGARLRYAHVKPEVKEGS